MREKKNIEFHYFTYDTIAIASYIGGTEIIISIGHGQNGHKCV